MTRKPVVIDERMAELDLLACGAHSIDEKQCPEMADLINRFLVLDAEDQNYRDLADRLMSADTSKRMPDEVADFVKAVYECDIEKGDALAANKAKPVLSEIHVYSGMRAYHHFPFGKVESGAGLSETINYIVKMITGQTQILFWPAFLCDYIYSPRGRHYLDAFKIAI